jgi:hypothetical protein
MQITNVGKKLFALIMQVVNRIVRPIFAILILRQLNVTKELVVLLFVHQQMIVLVMVKPLDLIKILDVLAIVKQVMKNPFVPLKHYALILKIVMTMEMQVEMLLTDANVIVLRGNGVETNVKHH